MSILSQSISQEYWVKKVQHSTPIALFHAKEELKDVPAEDLDIRLPIPSTSLGWIQGISGGVALNQHLIYLAALGILLTKYSNENELIVMTPDFAWEEKETQPGIRFYFKMLVKAEYGFKELLYQMLEEFNEILDQHDYQSDSLDQRFGSGQTLEALKQFSFSYDGFNTEKATIDTTALAVSISKGEQGGHFLELMASSAKYTEVQLQHLGQDYLLLLDLLSTYPDRPLGALQLLNPQQEERLLATQDIHLQNLPQKTLIAVFEEQVKLHPESLALRFKKETMTYQELNERANALAHYLTRENQSRVQAPVAVMLRRSPSTAIALLGILKAGRAFLPLDPDFPVKRKQHILEDAAVQLLLTDSGFMLQVGKFYQGVIFDMDMPLDEFMSQEQEERPEILGHSLKDLAYVLYTSGSTGAPKGVEVTEANIANYIDWANRHYFQHQKDKPFAFCTSITFDLTLTSFFSSLTRGDTLVIIEEQDIEATLREVFTMPMLRSVKLTPSHISLLQEINLDSTPVDTVILGGEALHQKQVDILRALNPEMRIFNEYGPTETTVGCMVKEIGDTTGEITIGHAIANTSIHILDAHNCILPPGVVGELAVNGMGLAKGYLGQPELTKENFVTIGFNSSGAGLSVYKTGDLAIRLPNGEIQYLGRQDNQVKINGHRIELEEIKRAIGQHNQVREACVVHRENTEKRQFIIAYYVADDMLSEQALRHHLMNHLPDYMVPAFCVKIKKIPLTRNGKINEKGLPLPESMTGMGNYEAPTSPIEKNLATIWQEVLEVQKIGVSDNFFLLGGDSIKAIRIRNKIQKILGNTLAITMLFESLTIKELAYRLRKDPSLSPIGQKDGTMPIEPISKASYYEVSSAQRRIWMASQIEEINLSFIIFSWRPLESINVQVLEKAFLSLIERYEILRTVFIEIDGYPKQKILEDFGHITMQQIDLRDNRNKEKSIEGIAEKESRTRFDLAKGPLLRAKLIQMGDDEHVVFFSLHHIITDGWTMGVLFNVMKELYESHLMHGKNVLPALNIQYKDYAAWEGDQLSGKKLQYHEEHWMEVFKDSPPPIKLPTDYPRPEIHTYDGTSTYLTFDIDVLNQLKKLGKEHNTTLFAVMMTSLYVLLYRYSNQKDIVIGSPFLGRDLAELENQVGVFINILPIRTQLAEEGETFARLLAKVGNNLMKAQEHQVYPFEKIITNIGLKKDLSRSPLFDVTFSFFNPGEEGIYIGEDVEMLQENNLNTEKIKYDLMFLFSEYKKGMFGTIRYNLSLFDKATIELLRTHFIEIFKIVISKPDIRLDEIKFSSEIAHNHDNEILIKENFNTKF